jgi:superfamily II DNA/RNA helicase
MQQIGTTLRALREGSGLSQIEVASWLSSNYKATKGGQVIFCDRVFSSDASFNIHEKIKKELIGFGFKENDIIIVNGFTKSGGNKSDSVIEKEVSKAIADYNAGKYKVIIGSTACIGEGVNLQKNSSAVHHFDIPFRPSDFIQRNGRVDRQGNEQDKVSLNSYLAAGTIDNYSVNLVQRKANWIDQLLRTKSEVFTNPNDENSIDADELLLALTEEWGDKEAAIKRKEELEKQKQEKIIEAQTKQMKGHLKNLSLTRGALEGLAGNENTAEYKKRMTQINSIEAALKNNPVFNKPDLFDNREPFLFNANTGMIFKKNDIISTCHGNYSVDGFDFKKQELVCSELISDEKLNERKSAAKRIGHTINLTKNIKLSEIKPNKYAKYSHYAVLHHFENAQSIDKEMFKNIGSENFYSLPCDKKEMLYDVHIEATRGNYNKFVPVFFEITSDGFLKVEETRHYYSHYGKKHLNPFSPEGKTAIIDALENGIELNNFNKDDIIKTLSNTIPELKPHVLRAIEKDEIQQEQNQTKLKEELNKLAAAKTNTDTEQIKNRVHVSGIRL